MTADPDLRAVLPQGGLTLFSRGAIAAVDCRTVTNGGLRRGLRCCGPQLAVAPCARQVWLLGNGAGGPIRGGLI